MTEKTRLSIINLCKFVFEDGDYNKAVNYLHTNNLHNLRLLVDERYDILSIVAGTSGELSDSIQLRYCEELENLIFEEVINTV